MKNRLLPFAALTTCLLFSVAHGAGDDPVPPAAGTTPWGAEYFPNVPLVTQEGKSVRFFDDLIRGKVVVINFIYTSCPDACPLETAKLGEVYALLRERAGKDVFFLSVTIDPARDTPEVLADYARRYQAGPGWLFLTGKAEDIALLRHKLGMIRPEGEENLSDHSLSLLIGNQVTGQWMKRSPFDNPRFLAQQIGGQLFDWKEAPGTLRKYSEAPELPEVSRGESLFRTRCLACHVIGVDDGIARQGPDLMGVTDRREHAWLTRWLAEPDAMLAEKDPIATQLFAAYRDVPMPNMRLNELEIEALLEYVESETRAIQAELESWEEPAEASPERVEDWSSSKPASRAPCCEKRDLLVLGDEEPVTSAATKEAPSSDAASALTPFCVARPRPSSGAEHAAPAVPSGPGSLQGALWLCASLSLVLGLLGWWVGRGPDG